MKRIIITFLLLASLAFGQTSTSALKDGSNVSGPAWKTNLGFLEEADVDGIYQPLIADGGLSLSKLDDASATSGQVIKWNGSAWAPAEDTGGTVDNAAINTAIAEDETATRNALNAPKLSIPPGASFGGKFMDFGQQENFQVRALYFGDSICYPPDYEFKTLFGNGGYINSAALSTLAGGATNGLLQDWSKSPVGSYVNLSTGTVTTGKPDALTVPFLARQIHVWYWSETGGGTFVVQTQTNGTGAYTTLTSANSTISGTGTVTGATGVVDAAEGGSGALRLVTFTLANPAYVLVRCDGAGSAGSAKICALGGVEVASGGTRLPGFVGIDCSYSGSNPTQWDDLPDAAITTLMQQWNPDFVYFRGYETLSQWQNEFAAFATKIRAAKPGVQIIVAGMHVTADNNTNVLDDIDEWQQNWCDSNDATFIPIRNRMGLIDWSVSNYLTKSAATLTITGGVNATGVITTSAAHGGVVGNYIRFDTLTGGSNLKTIRAYRILTAPTTTTLTICDIDGTTPVSLGSDITSGTFTLVDGTHMSLKGASFANNIVFESFMQAVMPRIFLDGHSPFASGWQRGGVKPGFLQPNFADRYWDFSGPTFKRRAVRIGRMDGSGTTTGYGVVAEFGASLINNTNEAAYIAGPNGVGFGMAWDANYGIIGANPRGIGRNLNTGSDMLEVYNANNGLTSLAVGTSGTTTSHSPLTVWRNGVSTSSKGTEVARVDATGQAKFAIRTFADDAAADADATLLSGMLYRTTAGGRTIFQKP